MENFYSGQTYTLGHSIEAEGIFGKKIISKGQKAVIGADKLLHFRNGTILELDGLPVHDNVFYLKGVAEWISSYLRIRFEIDQMLEDYEDEPEDLIECIVTALEDFGFKNNGEELD